MKLLVRNPLFIRVLHDNGEDVSYPSPFGQYYSGNATWLQEAIAPHTLTTDARRAGVELVDSYESIYSVLIEDMYLYRDARNHELFVSFGPALRKILRAPPGYEWGFKPYGGGVTTAWYFRQGRVHDDYARFAEAYRAGALLSSGDRPAMKRSREVGVYLHKVGG